jgi:hypothetical protein
MAAPERFADSQIPLAPRAPSFPPTVRSDPRRVRSFKPPEQVTNMSEGCSGNLVPDPQRKKFRNRLLCVAICLAGVTRGFFDLNTLIRARFAGVAATSTTAGKRPSSDEALIARIANGDRFAMEVLFARHRTRVYRWLLRFVNDERPH